MRTLVKPEAKKKEVENLIYAYEGWNDGYSVGWVRPDGSGWIIYNGQDHEIVNGVEQP